MTQSASVDSVSKIVQTTKRNTAELVFVLVGFMGFAGCNKPQSRKIYIDGWWDLEYARNLCKARAVATGIGCVPDGPTLARQLEIQFTSAFQTNSACNGVSLLNDYHDPQKDGAKTKLGTAEWALSFNISVENGELIPKDSVWQIIDHNLKRFAEGDMGDATQAATKVCTMVKNQGGTAE